MLSWRVERCKPTTRTRLVGPRRTLPSYVTSTGRPVRRTHDVSALLVLRCRPAYDFLAHRVQIGIPLAEEWLSTALCSLIHLQE
ncbi:hypothetical protein Bxe_B0462 [Paraburkholderia xenovorans LB400]|uniref:Uncharacterized protein n=1 Tax=Paraburkholderia xenovorans (strain LB400) TaxID=266265 RepID=Q13KA4_PARXL|nr:hypothetical protein Bxe_B0462 [Paraburkholderia xenovorans LB400]